MSDFVEMDPDEMIRRIIGRNKIKYTTLSNLIGDNINNLRTFTINVDSILIDLHKYFDKNPELDKYDFVYTIASSLINIVAHYRYYFSINRWYPNIYLLGDKNDICNNISTALEIVRIILRYIDKSYFIDTSGLKTGIIIKYFLNKKSENLILSRDDFDIMHLSKNTTIIKANKDNSKYYTKENWQKVISGKNYKEGYENVSYKLLNIILCFSGAHGRAGIKGLGFRTMIKKLSKAIDSNKVINDYYTNINDFISDIGDSLKKYNLNKGITNFEIYDVNSNYDKCINKAIEKRLDSYIEDKFSKKDLIMLNSKYFTGLNSLMLAELMTQPKYQKEIKW